MDKIKSRKFNIGFPSTFEIALLLTGIVFILILIFTKPGPQNVSSYAFEVLKYWQEGFWELLEFTIQMILILVFGYSLAISDQVNKWIAKLSNMADTNLKAVLITGTVTLIAGYINWGFGLVIGAILARKMGEVNFEKRIPINYPLVCAAGYLGMMVWHSGLSGSSTLKVAEKGHFLESTIGVLPVSETIFSQHNFLINSILVIVLLLILYLLSKKKTPTTSFPVINVRDENELRSGKGYLGAIIGILILSLGLSDFIFSEKGNLGFFDLNFVNFLLLGIGLLLFKNLKDYVKSLEAGLKSATDILIQFPFYAGIMGMIKYSGFLEDMGSWLVNISTAETIPLLSFFSAAVVNLFIPSGGGQWAIQGPILMETAMQMGVDPSGMVLSFAYGDQLTNMLQPFWALPLLSITGISAKDILKYTIYFFLCGLLVFGLGIWNLIC
ncbi:TIGR00366 family protein [Aquiflexum sp.]|uniref:TIGR00366 family protein n=1 Tax=Aquiflexum sp. TaxID=1872584 RepID=UPI00359332E8